MSEPTPPHSEESERAVIGAILVHSQKLVEVMPLVSVDDFYHPALRAVYAAMLDLDAASKPIDAATVTEAMRSQNTHTALLAAHGGDFLVGLMAEVVTVENVAYHARTVHRKAERRRWLSTLRELVAAGYSGGDDKAWFERAEQELIALTTRSTGIAEIQPIKAAMGEFVTELQYRAERKKAGNGGIVGVTTGYGDIDHLLSGLRDGALYVIAGRPGSGKSALVMNVVEHSARSGVAWLVFSLEMAQLELAQRMVSGNARIDGQRLSQGEIENVVQWQQVFKAVEKLVSLPIWFSDRADISIAGIRSAARRWRMGAAAKFEHVGIAIDYLQLLKTAERKRPSGNREQDVSEMSRGAKLLSRELKCPVIALAQLNRSLESRTDKRPMLSDLRESGAIEQDADAVGFVYRDAMYHDKDTCHTVQCEQCARHDIAEFIVPKQRSGPTGMVELIWKGEHTRFESMSRRDDR